MTSASILVFPWTCLPLIPGGMMSFDALVLTGECLDGTKLADFLLCILLNGMLFLTWDFVVGCCLISVRMLVCFQDFPRLHHPADSPTSSSVPSALCLKSPLQQWAAPSPHPLPHLQHLHQHCQVGALCRAAVPSSLHPADQGLDHPSLLWPHQLPHCVCEDIHVTGLAGRVCVCVHE